MSDLYRAGEAREFAVDLMSGRPVFCPEPFIDDQAFDAGMLATEPINGSGINGWDEQIFGWFSKDKGRGKLPASLGWLRPVVTRAADIAAEVYADEPYDPDLYCVIRRGKAEHMALRLGGWHVDNEGDEENFWPMAATLTVSDELPPQFFVGQSPGSPLLPLAVNTQDPGAMIRGFKECVPSGASPFNSPAGKLVCSYGLHRARPVGLAAENVDGRPAKGCTLEDAEAGETLRTIFIARAALRPRRDGDPVTPAILFDI